MTEGIRRVVREDNDALKEVLDSSGLFPSEYLDAMIEDYLVNPESDAIWFTMVKDGKPVSLSYCEAEKFTEGTYNLYAIAVKKGHQGKGIGRQMIGYIERELHDMGHRILIVETSTDPEMELTREFYIKCGYREEARIQDFWKEGEGKVVYWKKLKP